MGYSRIYGIKGNLSNFTLYRCRENYYLARVTVCQAKQYYILLLVREAPFRVTRLVYLLASIQTCCSLKD